MEEKEKGQKHKEEKWESKKRHHGNNKKDEKPYPKKDFNIDLPIMNHHECANPILRVVNHQVRRI